MYLSYNLQLNFDDNASLLEKGESLVHVDAYPALNAHSTGAVDSHGASKVEQAPLVLNEHGCGVSSSLESLLLASLGLLASLHGQREPKALHAQPALARHRGLGDRALSLGERALSIGPELGQASSKDDHSSGTLAPDHRLVQTSLLLDTTSFGLAQLRHSAAKRPHPPLPLHHTRGTNERSSLLLHAHPARHLCTKAFGAHTSLADDGRLDEPLLVRFIELSLDAIVLALVLLEEGSDACRLGLHRLCGESGTATLEQLARQLTTTPRALTREHALDEERVGVRRVQAFVATATGWMAVG